MEPIFKRTEILATYAQYLVGRNANYGIGLSSIYKFDGLGLKNSFVSLAALYQSNTYRSDYNYNLNPGTANIFDGQAAVIQAFDSLLAGPLPTYMDLLTKEDTLTVSGQSMLQVMDPLDHYSWAFPIQSQIYGRCQRTGARLSDWMAKSVIAPASPMSSYPRPTRMSHTANPSIPRVTSLSTMLCYRQSPVSSMSWG